MTLGVSMNCVIIGSCNASCNRQFDAKPLPESVITFVNPTGPLGKVKFTSKYEISF